MSMKELPTIQELQSFIAYNKMGNFTLAAQSLNITQSAFSAQMKKLERVVGVKLIDRSTRGSSLTREGERFLPEAEQLIEDLERTIHTIRLSSKLERPILNIGVLRSLGDVRMNDFVAHFYKHYQDFTISVYDMEEEELLLDLRENRIDIAVLYLPNDKDMSMYNSVGVHEDSMVYYAPKLVQAGKKVSVQDMIEHQMVTYPPKYFMHRILKNYFAGVNLNHLRTNRLSNPYAMINYCRDNEAGAVISKSLLDDLHITEGYALLERPMTMQMCMAFRKSNSKWDSMNMFIDYVVAQYQDA